MNKKWKNVKLEDVVDILDNLRKPITKRDRIEGDYPYYGATGILSYVNDYIFSEKLVLIGEDGAKWDSGDNTAFIVEGKYWVNNHAHVIRPNRDKVLDEWIVYYINYRDLSPFVTGMTVPKLNQKNLRSIPIPLPPLPKQHRIVSILDHCFEAIDKAKANAEQNLQNAKELFESYLQGVFEERGEGWEEKRLGKVCNIIGGGTPSKSKKEYYEGSIPWATVRDMKKFYLDSTQFNITKEAVENSSTNVIEKGNVIIATRVGLGKVCLLEQDTAINQDLKGIIPKQGYEINKDYLFYWFQSIENFLVNSGTGMTVKGVRVDFVKSILFPFPSIAKQEEIVSWLDNIYTKSQNLEFYYQKRIDDLEELKKSILQKAFAGELKTEKMVEETPLAPISESVCCEAEKI